jgi:hypothetical protein
MNESTDNNYGAMWLLTINNPNLSYEQIEDTFKRKTRLKYMCISSEISKTGTPHFHIFIYLNRVITFAEMKAIMPQAHIDLCNARDPQSIINYVKKGGKWENTDKKKTQIDGTFYECGILPNNIRPSSKQWRDYGAMLDEVIMKVDMVINALTLISHDLSNNIPVSNGLKDD